MPSSLFSWHIIFMVWTSIPFFMFRSLHVHSVVRTQTHAGYDCTNVQTLRCKRLSFCPSSMHMSCTSPSFFISEPSLLRASSRSPDIVHTLFHYLTCELEHIASITITFKTAIEDNNNTTLTKKLRYIHLTILLSHCQNSNQTSMIFFWSILICRI